VAGVEATLAKADGTLTDQKATSNALGEVVLEVEADVAFGVRLAKAGYVESWNLGILSSMSGHHATILSQALQTAVLGKLSVTQDPAKGMAAGVARFTTDLGTIGAIGCATVEVQPSGQVFYFSADGPATPDKQSATLRTRSDYLILNVPAGPVTVTAKVGGVVVATGTGFVFPGAITFDISALGEGATNPTPADCPP
jgi:hypothetical protein